MNLKTMRETVKNELDRIPRGPEPQNLLRGLFWFKRMRSLGKKAEKPTTAFEVLQSSIESVKSHNPQFGGFEFHYDRRFFEGDLAEAGFYLCSVIPKRLDEDLGAVKELGRALLRFRNEVADKRVGPISFDGAPQELFADKLLDLINGQRTHTAIIRIGRPDCTPSQLADLLRRYFPQRLVRDVTIDDESIFSPTDESKKGAVEV